MLNKSEECSTIFDIGANIGYYSIQFGKKSDVVYAFEPMEYQYNELQRNLEINSLTNIRTVKKIVSSTTGRERIYFSGFENTGKSSLVKKTRHFEDISSITLDEFCEEQQIDNIDLIKIDVEGYEYKVLAGLKKMLKLKKVTHIFVELLEKNLNKAGSSSGEICDLLESYGYQAYSIKTGECKPYKRGNSESLVYFSHNHSADTNSL
jgi:FkbM family methyltransferase